MRTTLALIFAAALSLACGADERPRDPVAFDFDSVPVPASTPIYQRLMETDEPPIQSVLDGAGISSVTFVLAGSTTIHVSLADRARAIAALRADPRTKDVEILEDPHLRASKASATAPTEAR